MTNLRTPPVRKVPAHKVVPVHKVIVAQLLASVFIAAVSLLLSGTVTAYSVLLGALISALPNSYFAMHAFRYQGAGNADRVVRGFLQGELGKIVITIVLFALSFSLITNLNEPALILGFGVIHFTGIVASGVIIYSPPDNKTQGSSF